MSGRLPNVEPIKREPLATEIARRLVDYLLTGGVLPGERMPSERHLAEAFGVGRSAMREALKALTLLGLVEVRHGDGTYLKRDDSSLLPQVIEWGLLLGEQRTLDLVEARQKIETDIAGLAAARRDEADLTELRRLLARMEQLSHQRGDPREFVDVDVAFHLRVAEASRNTALRDILSGIQALLRVWIGRVIAAGHREASYQEHVPILAAIETGDVAAAEAAMDAHMRSAAGRLERALTEAQARGESPGRRLGSDDASAVRA
ncbi:MAG: FadR family transcriptional regulator [Chloroflexia bacterium]|nr:FadR family transcriptional regulator [Chloroflexia bacterium]